MQQPSLAGWRFYYAFYRWTLLNAAPRRCLGVRTVHVGRSRKREAEARVGAARQDPSQRSSDAIYGNGGRRSAFGRNEIKQRQTNLQRLQEAEEDNSWLDAEVRTSTEHPFDIFEPWDEVIRYKSFAGVMLQLSIPSDIVAEIEAKHGPLKDMKGGPGVRVEVGSSLSKTTGDGSTLAVQSVLASGTFNEIKLVRNLIYAHRIGGDGEVPKSLERGGLRTAEEKIPMHHWHHMKKLVPLQKLRVRSGAKLEVAKGYRSHTERADRTNRVIITGTDAEVEKALELLTEVRVRAVSEKVPDGFTTRSIDLTQGQEIPPAQEAEATVDQGHGTAVGEGKATASNQSDRSPAIRKYTASQAPAKFSLTTMRGRLSMPSNRVLAADNQLISQPSHQRTCILSLPDPDYKKSLFDRISRQIFPRCSRGGIRDMDIFVLEGPTDAMRNCISEIQGLVENWCARHGMPRCTVTVLNDQQHSAPVATVGQEDNTSGSASYHAKLAIPDHVDPKVRQLIIAKALGEESATHKGFAKQTQTTFDVECKESELVVKGPALAVVRGVKWLQHIARHCSRLSGAEPVSLRTVIPLMPQDNLGEGRVEEARKADQSEILVRDNHEIGSSEQSLIRKEQTGPIASTNPRKDPSTSNEYYVKVEIPSHPTSGKKFAPLSGGDSYAILESIRKSTGTWLKRSLNDTILEIRGPKAAVIKAKDAVQKTLSDACTLVQISTMQLRDVVPLTSVAELTERKHARVAEDMKKTLRSLTHPVVLVTSVTQKLVSQSRANTTSLASNLDGCRGVTISSFNSVTMAPEPIISFNLRIPSRSWDAINESRSVCVHILSASPQGAAIAHAFTQPYDTPEEPFRRLQQLGAFVYLANSNSFNYLRLSGIVDESSVGQHQGVIGYMDAKVIREKCVEVGDHVIVVARVMEVRLSNTRDSETESTGVNEMEGLAYAGRGYRGAGHGIEPLEIPALEEVDSNVMVESNPAQVTQTHFEADAHVQDEGHASQSAPASLDEQQYAVGSAADGSATAVDDGTVPQASPNEVDPEDPVAAYFQQAEGRDSDDPPSTITRHTNAHSDTLPQLLYSKSSRSGNVRPFLVSAHSTFSRRLRRDYSTARSAPAASANQEYALPARKDPISSLSQVTDSSILNSTVGDFLGVSDDNFTPPRFRQLLRAKEEAEDASRRLEQALADGTLTAGESARLESVIARNERRVAKKMALRSADDLRQMLDKGRVDNGRAQWLESSIEKGQAVVLDDAKQLRSLLQRGAIDTERFRLAKERLERENQTLNTETMRLRQMVEEEVDAGSSPIAEPPNQRKGFDGFQGNV